MASSDMHLRDYGYSMRQCFSDRKEALCLAVAENSAHEVIERLEWLEKVQPRNSAYVKVIAVDLQFVRQRFGIPPPPPPVTPSGAILQKSTGLGLGTYNMFDEEKTRREVLVRMATSKGVEHVKSSLLTLMGCWSRVIEDIAFLDNCIVTPTKNSSSVCRRLDF